MAKKRRHALDWKPWMSLALLASGMVALAAYVGPPPSSTITNRNP